MKFHSDPRVDQKSVLSPCVSKSDFLQKNIVKHWCLVIITKHCSDPLILNKLTTNYLCYTFLVLFSIFGSIIVKFENSKTVIDFNVLLSTLTLTGVPYHLKLGVNL